MKEDMHQTAYGIKHPYIIDTNHNYSPLAQVTSSLMICCCCCRVSIYIYDTVLHYDNSTLKQIFKKKQLNVTLEFVNRVYLLPSLDGTFHRTLINLLTLHAPQYC